IDPRSTAYNMALALNIGKEIDKSRLESALKKLLARHESLRTCFIKINDTPVQRVYVPGEIRFEIEYYELATEGPENTGKTLIRPFDLTRAPLVRSFIVKSSNNHYTWVLDIHHIVSDGTSHMILANDFTAFYNHNGKGLEPLKLQYKDFSQWQNGLIESGAIKVQEDYWLKQYPHSREIPRLDLPTDYKRPEVFNFKGSAWGFKLEGEEASRFKNLGAVGEGTLYMNFLAALNVLFYKYTNQTDIIIGTGIAGRRHADIQGVVGMFVNTLAMRNFPNGEKSYENFLQEVISYSVKGFENQDVQFDELVEKLDPERTPSRNPLFDILMVVQNYRGSELKISLESLSVLNENSPATQYSNPTSKFDMAFFVNEEANDVFICIEYYTGIFALDTIKRLASHFKQIVKTISDNPGVKLKEIAIISEAEKHFVLHEFNNTGRDYPREQSIPSLFEEQASRTPDYIALYGESVLHGNPINLTYNKLNEQSNRVANYLYHGNHITADQSIGIMMDRAVEMIIVVIGILEAGGAYIPISPSYPLERIKKMINDAGIKIILSQRRYIKTLNRLQWECGLNLAIFMCLDSDDVYGEEETEENQLMSRKLWEYVGETSVDEVTGGGWNSSYTGEPIPKEEMDEYGDNILKKLGPLFHPKMRVLEIGVASGISMYRIAPHVGLYYGTDLSGIIIEKNKLRICEEGHMNIKLMRAAAHEIDRLDEKDFDLIIINSVIQCFHGHNYLRNVIRKAVDLMGSQGFLFIGDIMDQDLKEDLIADLISFKQTHGNDRYKTKVDWSEELFISRFFLADLALDFPVIYDMEFSGKIHTRENELTRFRYDALIKIDKSGKKEKRIKLVQRHKTSHDLRHLQSYGTDKVALRLSGDNLAYIIYTSGSTGVPKGVMVNHRNVVRLVKNTNFIEFKPGERILQTGALEFDASTLEIWGALLNGLELVLESKQNFLEAEKLKKITAKHKITIMWMTSSFFNRVLTDDVEVFRRLVYLLVGGESLSPSHINLLRSTFPGVHVINGYGPTENTTFSTTFLIEKEYTDNIPIGRPIANSTAYVLDRDLNLLPFGVAGELYVGGDGVARGYLNSPELTSEKFIMPSATRNPFEKGFLDFPKLLSNNNSPFTTHHSPLYKTGDLARWQLDGPPVGGATKGIIEFLGRIDQQVKIRGFRIELGEIENRLRHHPDLKEATVIVKTDESGDKYLCAYFVSGRELEITELREALARDLPGYMIPAYFVRLDKMPLNSSGKIDRKKLPLPGLEKAGNYITPRNDIEKKLMGLWLDILGKDRLIAIDDNFFEVGGHSLRATVLTSKIQKELNVKVPLVEVFKNPTIKGLACYIRGAVKETYIAVEQAEKKEYYPLSSAQGRFYILQEVTPESTAYNTTAAFEVEGFFDKEKFAASVDLLIKRHDVLRTSFLIINGTPVQKVYDEIETKVFAELFSKSDPPEAIIKSFIRPFDLSKAPLLRVSLVETAPDRHILLFDMHHIICDGSSMTIFLKEFMTFYSGGVLPLLTLQYKDFAQWQHNRLKAGKLKKQQEYWLKKFPGELPVLNMPTDYPRPAMQSFEGDKFEFKPGKFLTNSLKNLIKEAGVTLYMALLAVYNILLARYSGQEDIIIGTTMAGRHHTDLQGIMGLLIETLVQRNYPSGQLEFKTFLEMVKQETLESHENQAFPFREIIRLVGADNEVSRNPVFDAMLIVQNFETVEFHLEGLTFSPYRPLEDDLHKTSKVDFTIEALEDQDKGEIYFTLEYCTRLYKRETMERFARHFLNIIAQTTANPLIPLAAIEVIDEAERKQLLETFNDTTYKSSKEIPRIVAARFQDQAVKEPDRIAIVGLGQFVNSTVYLTYRGLHESAANLAGILIEKGVRPETIVALMIESSIEMAVAIWGILKAGGAYLPIEPGAPKERIDYMLKDSNAKILINKSEARSTKSETNPNKTNSNDQNKNRNSGASLVLNFENLDFEFVSSFDIRISDLNSSNIAYIIYTSGTSGHPKGVMVEHGNLANYIVAVSNEIGLREDDTVLQQGSLVFDAFVEEFYPLLAIGGKVAIPGKMITRDIPALCQFIARHHVSMIASAPQMVNELNKALRDGLPGPLNARQLLSSMRIVLVGGDRVKTDYIDKFLEQAEVYNTYGPTESTVCATYYKCNEASGLSGDVPIGKPLAEYKIYIEDKYGGLAPIGVGGELCIGGPGVARGYLNNPELTCERFVMPSPTREAFGKAPLDPAKLLFKYYLP
ncbi:MAG: condensation domain-containing protein, partial [Acidobacteria bacterium]|nr:condensation domain-containing protein [Acidobacteriota bacterium]